MAKDVEEIATEIVDAGFQLHRDPGPGLLEGVYDTLFPLALERRGLQVESQVYVPLEIDGRQIERALRLDLLVEKQVIVEIKSVERLTPFHFKQVLTYLRLLDLRLALMINFGCATFKEGVHRIVNRYEPTASSPLRINQPPSLIVPPGEHS